MRLRAVCALAAGMLALRVSATTVLAPEFTDLVNGSDYIVHAMVKAVSSEKQPSSRGTKIVTHVALQIVDVIAGTPPSEVTLQLLGGRVGDEEVTVGGMPQFKAGDEDILFVAGNGHTICPLYGMMHGRFRVMTDGATGRRYVTRHNGAPLQNTGEIATGTDESAAPHGRALSLSALTPDEFVRQIRGARGSNVRSSQSK